MLPFLFHIIPEVSLLLSKCRSVIMVFVYLELLLLWMTDKLDDVVLASNVCD